MSTVQERHEADQDDADRYAQFRAVRRTSPRAHIHELTTEIDRLRSEYDGLRVEWGEALETIRLLKAGREERDATIERLTYDRNHPYGDVAPTEPAWHSSTSQCVRCLHPGEFAS
jgi:uncharacterized coiled-coil DUF342 family protein